MNCEQNHKANAAKESINSWNLSEFLLIHNMFDSYSNIVSNKEYCPNKSMDGFTNWRDSSHSCTCSPIIIPNCDESPHFAWN